MLINFLDLKAQKLFVATLGDTETRLCKKEVACWRLDRFSVVYDWNTPEEEARAYRFTREKDLLQAQWNQSQGKQRYFKGYNVSRALGHFDAINNEGESPFSLEPTVVSCVLEKGTVVIAASDGLWNYVANACVKMIVESDAKDLAEAIGKFALMKSKDNVTVLTLKV